MKFFLASIILASVALGAQSLWFAGNEKWNDLKVTWGVNPFGSSNFVSLPRTEDEAIRKGWIQDKNCAGGFLGNRYHLDNDKLTMLIYNSQGNIAGISASIPKNLPFGLPTAQIQKLFNDEGDMWTITAYFTDPDTVCKSSQTRLSTGDRLVFKSNTFSLNVALEESQIDKFWTKGQCFYTMGQHYWADITGPLDENTKAEDFVPIFLLYNSGKLNGFGWAFNADFSSKRYEHPTTSVLGQFFSQIPKAFYDPTQVGVLSTQHIYLDSTPWFNHC